MTQPRIRVPSPARQGEVIEIKTLLSHPMETGHRRDVSPYVLDLLRSSCQSRLAPLLARVCSSTTDPRRLMTSADV